MVVAVWDLVVEVEAEEEVRVGCGGCWRKALKKPERKKGRWVEGAMVGVSVGVCW